MASREGDGKPDTVKAKIEGGGRQQKKNNNRYRRFPNTQKFKGETEGLEGHIFDTLEPHLKLNYTAKQLKS